MKNNYIKTANQLADTSGKILQKYFRSTDITDNIDCKSDLSPVTKADREAEYAMRSIIEQQFPDHGIIGEEYGNHNAAAEYVWVLDPIDGTMSFISGKPLFTTLIALLHNGKPILGIINQPIHNERWLGIAGEKPTLNGVAITTPKNISLENAIISTTSPYLFTPEKKLQFEKIRNATKYDIYGGDAYSYAMLASGNIDIVIESGLKAHDIMALIPIIEGARGIITNWNGDSITISSNPTQEFDIIACGSKTLHQEVLNLMNNPV